MSLYTRRAYDDADTTATMHADCAACRHELHDPAGPAHRVMGSAPSIAYDDYPREVRKPTIDVDEAAVRLAARLELDLD